MQDLLKKAYHRLDMDDTVREMEVVRVYKAVVGDLISRLSTTVRFSQGVLTVQLASAALRQELVYRHTSLMDKINDSLGYPAVKKTIFI